MITSTVPRDPSGYLGGLDIHKYFAKALPRRRALLVRGNKSLGVCMCTLKNGITCPRHGRVRFFPAKSKCPPAEVLSGTKPKSSRKVSKPKPDSVPKAVDPGDTVEQKQEVIAGLRRRLAAVNLRYAQRLATSMWRKHWKQDAPNWKPYDDMVGVLTQIDNMVAGMVRANHFDHERMMLAKLAADSPQFCNPFDVVEAKKIRDKILSQANDDESGR